MKLKAEQNCSQGDICNIDVVLRIFGLSLKGDFSSKDSICLLVDVLQDESRKLLANLLVPEEV